jgi:hypothetical protein
VSLLLEMLLLLFLRMLLVLLPVGCPIMLRALLVMLQVWILCPSACWHLYLLLCCAAVGWHLQLLLPILLSRKVVVSLRGVAVTLCPVLAVSPACCLTLLGPHVWDRLLYWVAVGLLLQLLTGIPRLCVLLLRVDLLLLLLLLEL